MNKKFPVLLAKCMFGGLLVSGSLFADNEMKHIEVASRPIPHAERVALYEQIHEEEQKTADDQVVAAAKTFNTSHGGAYHHPASVSAFGDTVELEDGSIWKVRSSDKTKTLNWMTSDILVVTQNKAWFSNCYYSIVNITTGTEIEVNMLLGPWYNGAFTHWVSAIDYANRRVYMEDGSIWEIGGTWVDYQNILNSWLSNETIIIGVNGDSNPVTPNVLINVNTNTWVKAKCIY